MPYVFVFCQKFFKQYTRSASHKRKVDKLENFKIKNFCSSNDMIKRVKRKNTEWKKIFVIYISKKGLMSRIYKNSNGSRRKRETTQ